MTSTTITRGSWWRGGARPSGSSGWPAGGGLGGRRRSGGGWRWGSRRGRRARRPRGGGAFGPRAPRPPGDGRRPPDGDGGGLGGGPVDAVVLADGADLAGREGERLVERPRLSLPGSGDVGLTIGGEQDGVQVGHGRALSASRTVWAVQ